MKWLPKARTADLATQNLKDEILIYNLKTDEAFCLNETSANIFNACDGATTFDELKARHHYSDEIIYLALDGLIKENLIESDYVSPLAGISRRKVIRKVGLASLIALPIISSLIAPPAAHAVSATACTPGVTLDDPNGVQELGGTCVCGLNSNQNGGGIPLCNTTRGGGDLGCKSGCICRHTAMMICDQNGACFGTCT